MLVSNESTYEYGGYKFVLSSRQTPPYAAVFYGYWFNFCFSWTLIVRVPLLTIPVSSTTQQIHTA
ncbi:hypothetical protein BO99DRAFT_398523 [Aspergillus violaceofuscus CBS 115571]|uniref:Uncharacterized protein n=1 Tax=Aspergillus violaceofuscus (strain CBS 115571) TaxID=1450538 RepID=A0A2V5I5Y2_ASPV1|nr:hypothetical protein BO99DRAFT_398523 [Aspergillus violaceofuscus CBS 115571]